MSDSTVHNLLRGTGVTRRARLRDVMLVAGDTPVAWAPAEGETLAGGGVLR